MLKYFTDPVLRAPTIGSMLMCLTSSLVGVIVFLKRRSLVGETLSHASYPGVIFGAIIASFFFIPSDETAALLVLVFAFIFSYLGLIAVDLLERHCKVKSDAALCFVLSMFFGVGVLLASHMQAAHALWYRQVQVFLYGQTATMMDRDILIYALFACMTILGIFLFYHPLKLVNFDRDFAKSMGVEPSIVDTVFFFLLVLAIVIGIRSVGVVLMSGMLIAPVVAARSFTHRFSMLLGLSAVFGMLSGYWGNFFSLEVPGWVSDGKSFSLPTGPAILLVAVAFAIFSLLFAYPRGVVTRVVRIARFRFHCLMENSLKTMWKKGGGSARHEIAQELHVTRFFLFFVFLQLQSQGWIEKVPTDTASFQLTKEGERKAARIVRLHRLWEVYLANFLGLKVEKVHRNAEEMEHIITPELEEELVKLLENPKQDPHHQPIPL